MRSGILHYQTSLAIALISALALVFAFILQYRFGLAPCHLCILERWPYLAALVVGIVGAALSQPRLALVVLVAVLAVETLLAAFHVGVEQGWIALPSSCVAGAGATSIDDLRAQLMNAPPTCDSITAMWLGLSLPAWNAILAVLLTLTALFTAMRRA